MFITINEIAKKEECLSISDEIRERGFYADHLVKCKRNKWGHFVVESSNGLINLYRSSLAFPRYLACQCKFCEKNNDICTECDPIWDFGK